MQSRVRKASTRVDTPARNAPGQVVTPELYAAARAVYLETGNPADVRRATGLSAERCSRLIDSGEPRLGLPSLRDAARAVAAEVDARATKAEKGAAVAVAKEHAATLEARARAARSAREHETRVLGDAVRSRADEVRLVRANRQSALILAGINASLLKASAAVADSLLRDVETGRLAGLDPYKRLGILRTVAGIVHRTAQASAAAVNMERLLMGEPTAILGRADGTGPSTSDMTPDEAEQWLHLANRAFARRAARRTVVDVAVPEGQGEPTDEDVLELTEDLDP